MCTARGLALPRLRELQASLVKACMVGAAGARAQDHSPRADQARIRMAPLASRRKRPWTSHSAPGPHSATSQGTEAPRGPALGPGPGLEPAPLLLDGLLQLALVALDGLQTLVDGKY